MIGILKSEFVLVGPQRTHKCFNVEMPACQKQLSATKKVIFGSIRRKAPKGHLDNVIILIGIVCARVCGCVCVIVLICVYNDDVYDDVFVQCRCMGARESF